MRSRAERQAYARLLARADASVPKIAKQIHAALKTLQDSVSLETLEQIVASQDAFGLHDLASSLPKNMRPALASVEQLFGAGAQTSLAGVVRVGATLQFDVVNTYVVTAAALETAHFVREVTEETRKGIREVIARGAAEGIAPKLQAKMLAKMVGLTKRQSATVSRRFLARVQSGLPETVAMAALKRDAARTLKLRAFTIARTETIRSSTLGQIAGWKAARSAGLLGPTAAKRWIVTLDDRLCPYCAAMQDKVVMLDAPFTTPHGRIDGPPLHPNCRCTVSLEPDIHRLARAA